MANHTAVHNSSEKHGRKLLQHWNIISLYLVIYDAIGQVITSGIFNDTSVQIQLPSTLKGVVIVKVNTEVIKVMCK